MTIALMRKLPFFVFMLLCTSCIAAQTPVKHSFDLKVVSTNADLKKGLMHQKEMAPNEGMLFVFKHSQRLCFWMKNTVIPLDVLLINDAGVVLEIMHDMVPHSTTCRCFKHKGSKAIEVLSQKSALRSPQVKVGDLILAVPPVRASY